MACGATALVIRLAGWRKRQPWRHQIEYAPAAVGMNRRQTIGAWVDESAIQLQVKKARAGESEALGELFDAHRPDLLRLCTRLLGPVDAEDATNESFRRAQIRLDQYDSAQPLGRWMRAIAAHECIDRLRRRSVEARLFEPAKKEIDDFGDHAASALDALVQSRRQSEVRTAIDSLPDRYRAPLILRYFADMDYDAIAEELELTRSQVATALFRAKQQLRGRLRNEEEPAR